MSNHAKYTTPDVDPILTDSETYGVHVISNRPYSDVLRNAVSQFGEVLVVERTPIVELNSAYGVSAIRDIQKVANGGTIVAAGGEIRLRTGTTANGSAHLDTTEAGRYQPGYGSEIGIGIRIPTVPTGNQEAKWGAHSTDEQDGFYFGMDATGVYVAVLRGGSEVYKKYQSDWNIDKLDGTGDSGLTLDVTAGNIYQLDYTWYGYGQILWGVVTVVGAQQRFIPIHQFKPSTVVSVESPNLQVWAEVDNGGDTNNFDMYVGGRQVSVIGRYNPQYRYTGDWRSSVNTSTTVIPTVSFRHKSGFQNISVKVDGLTVKPATEDIIVELILGGTLTNESWGTPNGSTDSETAVESDVSATAITGGTVIWTELFPAGTANKGLGTGAALTVEVPTNQVVSLCVRTISGTGTCRSFFRLQEEW